MGIFYRTTGGIIIMLLMIISLGAFHFPIQLKYEEWKAPAVADSIVNPLAYSANHFKNGGKLFENLCWSCHGLDGKGKGPVAETLIIKPADFSNKAIQSQSDGALYWKISSGRGVMAAYGQVLTATQRWQLVQYIRSFKLTNDAEKYRSQSSPK